MTRTLFVISMLLLAGNAIAGQWNECRDTLTDGTIPVRNDSKTYTGDALNMLTVDLNEPLRQCKTVIRPNLTRAESEDGFSIVPEGIVDNNKLLKKTIYIANKKCALIDDGNDIKGSLPEIKLSELEAYLMASFGTTEDVTVKIAKPTSQLLSRASAYHLGGYWVTDGDKRDLWLTAEPERIRCLSAAAIPYLDQLDEKDLTNGQFTKN